MVQYILSLVVTGEEEEDTMVAKKCKLFAMEDGSWKERGVSI